MSADWFTIDADKESGKLMTATLDKIEKLLEAIVNGGDDMIPVERVSHVLRVLRTQREMHEEGLFEN